jgi:uncharacterized protein YaiI (UPF0178 family)
MKIFIDGDAFPNALKSIIYKAITKHSLTTNVVSNKRIYIGNSDLINNILVSSNPDEADNQIAEMVMEGDLVITSDVPLADRVVTKKAFALDHRGRFFDEDNIKQALAMRDFMESIRETGEITKGQSPFSQKDVHSFASSLNQFLQKK